jgi:hypothetical protein
MPDTASVALISGAASLLGAVVAGAAGGWFGVRQAQHTGGASMKVGELERAAAWQVQKRQKYVSLLDATRGGADDLDVAKKLTDALLAANQPLRSELLSFTEPKDLREHLQDQDKYKKLVEAMTADVRERTES